MVGEVTDILQDKISSELEEIYLKELVAPHGEIKHMGGKIQVTFGDVIIEDFSISTKDHMTQLGALVQEHPVFGCYDEFDEETAERLLKLTQQAQTTTNPKDDAIATIELVRFLNETHERIISKRKQLKMEYKFTVTEKPFSEDQFYIRFVKTSDGDIRVEGAKGSLVAKAISEKLFGFDGDDSALENVELEVFDSFVKDNFHKFLRLVADMNAAENEYECQGLIDLDQFRIVDLDADVEEKISEFLDDNDIL